MFCQSWDILKSIIYQKRLNAKSKNRNSFRHQEQVKCLYTVDFVKGN